MQYTQLTKNYKISQIIKGNWQLSDSHSDSSIELRSIQDLKQFLDNGITTFDMADIYTGVEELFGKFLQDLKNNHPHLLKNVKIHTKYVPDRDLLNNLSIQDTEKIVDRSLKRLGVEQLNLVQFHWWDYNTGNYLNGLDHLFKLQKKGKIQHIGLTNFSSSKIKEIINNGFKPISIQIQSSLLDQRANHHLLKICQKNDIKFLCYGVLAGGFLSKQWLGKPDPAKHENRSLTKYRVIIDEIGGWDSFQEILQKLNKISQNHKTTLSNIAANYILNQNNVAALIIGSRNTKHLESTRKIADIKLSEYEKQSIKNLISKFSISDSDFYELERNSEKHSKIMKYNLNNG